MATGSLTGRVGGLEVSSDSGSIDVENAGIISSATGGGILASTASTVNIVNSGTITGSTYGIYADGNVSGGLISNSGIITAAEAISVNGNNIRVELYSSGQINGNITLGAGNGNTLSLDSGIHNVGGSVDIRLSELEITINSDIDFSRIIADGQILINGADLVVNIADCELNVGDSFLILQSDAGIVGSFGDIEEEWLCTSSTLDGIYTFVAEQYDNELYLRVVSFVPVPEPSVCVLAFGLFVLGFAALRRNRSKN